MPPAQILIVEDEIITAQGIRHTLTRVGYEVPDIATSGQEAMDKTGKLQPDLVLMDIRLKGEMDGIEAAGLIRAQFDIPIIYLTAHTDEETLARARLTEPAGYLLKPFTPDALRSTLETALYKHQAEKRVRESEERYRRLVDRVPVGLYWTTPQGQFLDVNPTLVQLLGYPDRDSLMAINAADLYKDSANRREWQAQLERQGTLRHFEARFRRRDGTIIWMNENAYVVRDAAGQVVSYEGSLVDITERKQADAALRASEAKYRVLFESFPLGISVLDEEGNILEVNEISERLLGLSRDEHLRRKIDDARWRTIRADGRPMPPEEYAALRALQESRPIEDAEMGVVKDDGDVTWLSVTAAPMQLPAHRVVVTYGDITDRKQAEEALRESEERYRLLAETTRDIIVLHDMEGRILYVNQAGLDFAGFDRSEAIGRSIASFIPAEHQAAIVVRGGQRAAGDQATYLYETEFVNRAGQCIPIEVNSTPVLRRGQVSEILVVARDITERKRAEAELKRSNRELEHFAYAVSHDLQEPLRMVSSFLTLLARRSGEQLAEESREFLDYALDGAERMQAMIRGLLELSRVTRHGREFAPVDCETVLAQTLHILQVSIAESGAEISHDPLPVVWADELQMGQVFQNLIGNALKFRGPEPPRVHISAERQGEYWYFAVQDNGIGLDPAQADYILGVFQRLHTREEYPGIGLGLTICKKIVERHGGRIGVESEPGQGATFYFTLPASSEEAK